MPHEDVQLPRGSGAGRACDIEGCARPGEELLGQAGGSVLLVCHVHAIDLLRETGAEQGPAPGPDSDSGSGSAPDPVHASGSEPDGEPVTGEPSLLRAAALLACAVGCVVAGLVLCASAGPDVGIDQAGIALGTFGCWLAYRTLLPRNPWRD